MPQPSGIAVGMRSGTSLPTTGQPGRNNLFFLVGGGSPGLYQCLTTDTWTIVASAGGPGTVTSVSVTTANGVSGSVATATTTPAITLTLGAITPTTVNKVTITAPATGSTLTLVDGKTFTVNNTITLAGTDAQTYTFPTTSATLARTDAANTFTGHQTIEGVTSTGATGTGRFVFDGTPTLVTPVLGVATATSINGNVFTTGTYTLTGTAGKTLTFSNSITLAGTDATTMTFPTTSATIARTDAANTFTGHQTIEGVTSTGASGSGKIMFNTNPSITTGIRDTNGLNLLSFTATASAVYGATLTNAALLGTVAWGVTAPTQVASGVAGTPVSFAASDAVAGSSNAGAVAGGAVTIQAGNAARLTSGNAGGGAINLTTGTGIGTTAAGNVVVANGGVIVSSSGTGSALAIGIGGTLSGFYLIQASDIGIIVGNSAATIANFNQNGSANEVNLASGATLGWGSNTNSAQVNSDTMFTRQAAAVIGLGNAAAASPVNYTVRGQASRSGTDSNVAGATVTISSGLGTGTGTISTLVLASPIAVGSGTGAQTQTTGLTIIGGSAKLVSYTVANLPAAATVGAGAMAYVTDSTATAITGLGLAVVGSGSNKVMVISDGTNWIVQ